MTKSTSAKLSEKLAQLIEASTLRGFPHQSDGAAKFPAMPCLTFRDYMAHCLYDEQYGYYRTGRARIGKKGDFYTSSSTGNIMAVAIDAYCGNYEEELGRGMSLIEWGAGTGRLAAAIALARQNRLARDKARFGEQYPYVCVENHPAHSEAIRQAFQEAGLDSSLLRIRSSEQMEGESTYWFDNSLIIANELLDAFPVHRICRQEGRLWELGVACEGNNHFIYTLIPLDVEDCKLQQCLKLSELQLTEGQTTELCPDAGSWIELLGKRMTKGRVMLIDYGHEAAEYYSGHRMRGTLLTYFRHQASDLPFRDPGERDMTAHVNFTYMRSVAVSAGFREIYYDTQKQFLLDNGVLELLRAHDGRDPFSEAARRNRSIRQLLLSDEMSETFKVMILEKP